MNCGPAYSRLEMRNVCRGILRLYKACKRIVTLEGTLTKSPCIGMDELSQLSSS